MYERCSLLPTISDWMYYEVKYTCPYALYSILCSIGRPRPLPYNSSVSWSRFRFPLAWWLIIDKFGLPPGWGSLLSVATAEGASIDTRARSSWSRRENLQKYSASSTLKLGFDSHSSIKKICNNIAAVTTLPTSWMSKSSFLHRIPQRMTTSPNVHSIWIWLFDSQKLKASSGDKGFASAYGTKRCPIRGYAESPTKNFVIPIRKLV